MAKIYTISYLKKHIVNLSKEDTDRRVARFIASHDNSKIFFSVPQEVILSLGRLFQKKEHLELGYLIDEDIWYVLQKSTLLWSNKVLLLKKEDPEFTRYKALKRDFNNNPQ